LDPDAALEVVPVAARGDDAVPARSGLVVDAVARELAPVEVARVAVDVLDERRLLGLGAVRVSLRREGDRGRVAALAADLDAVGAVLARVIVERAADAELPAEEAVALDVEVDPRDLAVLGDEVERDLAVALVAADRAVEPVAALGLGDALALALPLLDAAEAALALDPDAPLEVVTPSTRRDEDVPARSRLVEDGEARLVALVEVDGITIDVGDERRIAGPGREVAAQEQRSGGDQSR